jgi:hypothetical protein
MARPLFDETSEEVYRELVAEISDERDLAAVIGAGLSVPGYPTWKALHARLQVETGSPRPWRPEEAPSDFMTFREKLGEERFLELLKEQFGRGITARQELYSILDEIDGLAWLMTLNFDEHVLSLAARNDSSVAVYPNFRPFTARYIYLHGRAYTARSTADLVLCESEYAKAYDRQDGPVLGMLGRSLRPLLFVGCSLQDADLARVLREARRLAYTRKEEDRPPLPFAILPAHFEDDDGYTTEQLVAIETERLRNRGVRVIWYEWDEDYTQLVVVLRQLRADVGSRRPRVLFLDRLPEVDALAASQAPSEQEQSRAVGLIRSDPNLAFRFFERVSSPAWIGPLLNAGLLTNVPEPHPDAQGRIRLPTWPAMPFLRTIAQERPDVLLELIRRLHDTKNWLVQDALSSMAQYLPDDLLEAPLPIFFNWSAAEYSQLALVSHNLGTLAARLIDTNRGLGSKVLVGLLQPRCRQNGEVVLTIATDDLESLDGILATLVNDAPWDTYLMLKGHLTEFLTLAAEDGSSVWRAAVEDHEQNFTHSREPLHFLVKWTRDAFLASFRTGLEPAQQELRSLLIAETPLLRRLGLFALAQLPDEIERLEDPVFDEHNFFDVDYFHEQAVLLHEHFGRLSDEQQSLIHRLIAEGPPSEDAEDADGATRLDSWRWHILSVIPDRFHTPEEREWLRPLVERWGVPEHPFFLAYMTLGWTSTDKEAVDLRQAYAACPERLMEVLREADVRWYGLRELVAEDPAGMLRLAPLFEPADFPHLGFYLESYGDVMKSRISFNWTPLLELAEHVCSNAEANAPGVSFVSRLLRNGFDAKVQDAGIPDQELDRAFSLVVGILDRNFTPLEQGLPDGRESGIHQLNTAPGQAADAFMMYIWRRASQMSDEERAIPGQAAPHITNALSAGW